MSSDLGLGPLPSPAAAGAAPVTLDVSYRRCRELNKRYGTTYYLSSYALPRLERHHVWALYAFCRYADDIVDDLGDAPVEQRRQALTAFGDRFFADVAAGRSDDPILKAVVHTVRAYGHDLDQFRRFLASMAMDLTVTTYATWDDLVGYMDGSAAVIGEMMLPILEPADPAAALGPARDLGFAFQLTNFLRDVAEDLDRGRVYLPQEDLAATGADPARRTVDAAWRRLARLEIARCRDLYRSAAEGIGLLPPSSARCIAAAHALYGQILDRIEAADYDVFSRRARVPTLRKLTTVAQLSLPRHRPA
jgi:phytoene synthase